MDIEELAVKITGDSTSLQTAMNQASESMGKLGINTSTLNGLLGAAGLTAALKMAYSAAADAQKAFAGAEVEQLRFNAAVAASAAVTAQGRTRLEELAEAFAHLAGVDDDAVLGMEAMLVSTGRTTEQIEKMLPAALGLANATGTSLDSALDQLNRTFSGSIGRLGMVTPALKELTQEELAAGKAVDVLAEKYGGLSDALADSAKTSMANYQTALGNVKETFGAVVEEGIKPFRDAATKALSVFAENEAAVSATLTAIGALLGAVAAAAVAAMAPVIASLAAALAAAGPIIAAVAGVTAAVAGVTYILTKNAQDRKAALDAEFDALTRDMDALDAARLKAVKSAQDRTDAEKKAAQDRADAEKKATEDAIAAQIKGRKEAEEAYRAELAATETRVKAGLITEQDAADAKYAANQKLINDLIALGYTGATETGYIGDKTLAAAISRNANLLANTTANVEAILTEEAKILEQQKEVDEWEKAYLEKKKAEADALATAHRGYVVKRLAATEEATKKEDAAWAELNNEIIAGSSGVAQRLEQDAQNRIKTQENYGNAMANASQRFAEEQTRIYEENEQEKFEQARGIHRDYINLRLMAVEKGTIKEEVANKILQDKIANGLTGTAQLAEQAAGRKINTEKNYYNAMANIAQQAIEKENKISQDKEQEKTETALIIQKQYINRRLTATEEVTTKETTANNKLQKEIIEGLSGTEQRAEQSAQNRIKTEQNYAAAMVNIVQRNADEQTRIYIEQEQERVRVAQDAHRQYVNKRLKATEEATIKETVANNKLQGEISAGLTGTAQLAEQMAVRRTKTEENYYNAVANIADREYKQYLALQDKGLVALSDNEFKLTMIKGTEADKQIAIIKANLQKDLEANKDNEELKKAIIEKAENDIAIIRINSLESALANFEKLSNAFNEVMESNAKKQQEAIDKEIDAVEKRYEIEKKEIDDTFKAAKKASQEKYKMEVAQIDEASTAQLEALDAEEAAKLHGLGYLTEEEKLQKAITDAKTKEDQIEAQNALDIYLTQQDFNNKRAKAKKEAEAAIKAAKEAADKAELDAIAAHDKAIEDSAAAELAATKKLEYDKAVIKYKADIAQYDVNIALAIAQAALAAVQAFAQLGPVAGAIAAGAVAIATAAEIKVMKDNKPQPPPALALGGVARGLTWVGERGAELVDLPAGSYVHDSQESKRIAEGMKGSGSTFIFNSPKALTPAEMKRQFKLAQRQAAFLGAGA